MLMKVAALVICFGLVCDVVSGQRNRMSRRQRNNGGGLPPHLRDAYNNVVDSESATTTTSPVNIEANAWHQFTPSLPADHEIECYVTVRTTYQQGGRCTRLYGEGGAYMCQSAQNLQFNPECEHIMWLRQMQPQQNQAQQGQSQQGQSQQGQSQQGQSQQSQSQQGQSQQGQSQQSQSQQGQAQGSTDS